MCLIIIIWNLTACQPFLHTFHWSKIKSLSLTLAARSTFRLLFFDNLRFPLSKNPCLGLIWTVLNFANSRCSKMEWPWRVSVEFVINKRKRSCHFAWRNSLIAVWMFVYPTEYGRDIGLKVFLISQKLFLLTSEYQCAMRSTKDWLKITRGNFTRRPTEVNFPSADWLSYLRTQLTAFVGGVCLRSRKIFSALFSRNNFFTRRGHFKELQVKGNLFDCSQILTVASFAYKQQKTCLRIFYFKILFFQERFLYDQSTFS